MQAGIKLILLSLVILISCKNANQNKTGQKLQHKISENSEDVVMGNPEAKHTVFMYGNYQCSFCRLFFATTLPALHEKYIAPGTLKLTIKFIDFNENPNVLQALQAASCISRFGDYSKFHPLLLANPDVVFTEEFDLLLVDIMQENDEIAECILNNNNYHYLRSNLTEFRRNQLKGTPTFVINNNAYRGYLSFAEMEKIITKELNM